MKNMFFKARMLLYIMILLFSALAGTSFTSDAAYERGDTDISQAFTPINIDSNFKTGDTVKVSSRFYELIFGKKEKENEIMLCPVGNTFGILIKEDGVTVCSSIAPGIYEGDRIIKIGSKKCYECTDVHEAVSQSGGAPLNITLIRNGEEISISATPKYKDGEYVLGITLRSQTAGIGTVTFIDPQTLSFGGLGHAVSDAETGAPVSVRSGIASGVTLGACKKGIPGKAGELSGILSRTAIGSIDKNTECGVFGVLDAMPENTGAPIPIAHKSDVKCGEAEIISTIKNGKTATYKIEISDIDHTSTGSKSFKIKVTDPTLITLTGGIVRGMSGSPIIQNGKLVGAVTHVMVADPTEGYGIFIENMLSAASEGALPKAA